LTTFATQSFACDEPVAGPALDSGLIGSNCPRERFLHRLQRLQISLEFFQGCPLKPKYSCFCQFCCIAHLDNSLRNVFVFMTYVGTLDVPPVVSRILDCAHAITSDG